MAEFDDLIPANAPAASGAFDDLVPTGNPFDDLVPQRQPVTIGQEPALGDPLRPDAELPVAPNVFDPRVDVLPERIPVSQQDYRVVPPRGTSLESIIANLRGSQRSPYEQRLENLQAEDVALAQERGTLTPEKAAVRAGLAIGQAGGELEREAGSIIGNLNKFVPSVALMEAMTDGGEKRRQFGRALRERGGKRSQKYAELGEDVGGGILGTGTQSLATTTLVSAPTLPAALLGGLPTAVATAGLQSFGGTYADAVDAYQSKGASQDEAEQKAFLPALASGLSTALITTAFSMGGMPGAELTLKFLTQAQMASLRTVLANTVKGAFSEGAEEFSDQVVQSLIAKASYQPEMTFEQGLNQSLMAGLAGSVLGAKGNLIFGGAGAAYTQYKRGKRKETVDAVRNSPEWKTYVASVGEEIDKEKQLNSIVDSIMASGKQKGAQNATNVRQQPESDLGQYRGVTPQVQTEGTDRQDQAALDATGAANSFSDLIPPGTAQAVAVAEAQTETAPSEAQKEAGNYAKGKVSIHGLPITIENPKGSQRTGKDKDGETWSVTMPATYGYIRRTEGKDGDAVDVYIGPQPDSAKVYVIDQKNLGTKGFDEHKAMLGYTDIRQAMADYSAAFSDGKGLERILGISSISIDQFKEWLQKGDTKKPFTDDKRYTNQAAELGLEPKPAKREVEKVDGLYVSVTAPVEVRGKTVPGYFQIDEVKGGKNTRSGMTKVLAEQGVQVPDFSTLPQGQYLYEDAVRMLSEAPPTPPVSPSSTPTTPSSPPIAAETPPLIAAEPAPVTPAKFEVTSPPQTGRPSIIAKGDWDIIDASEVGFVGGITQFQERNRRSEQSKQQMADIAARLDPRYLGESQTADQGAPIINGNGEKLAGFGRLEAIRQAYDAAAAPARMYREFVAREAARLGISDKLKDKPNPILVRRVSSFENGTAEQFASESNQAQALQFTPTELALSDAKVLKDSRLLDLFTISEQGVINRQFLDQFFNAIKARDGLKSTDGLTYLPAMERRVKIAILTALLSEAKNPEVLIRRVVEKGEDLGITRQINGLSAVAAKLLNIANLNPDYDLGPHLSVAFEEYIEANSQMEAGWISSIQDYMAQKTLFSNGRTPESGLILEVLWGSKSAKAVAEFFDGYSRRATAIARDATTEDMFGSLPTATVMEILDRSRRSESEAQQTELLGRRQPDESRAGEPAPTGAGGVAPTETSQSPAPLPFEQLSQGHKKFHGALQRLVENGTLDQERLVLLEEIFRNTSPAFLEAINVEDSRRMQRAGIAFARQRRLVMKRALTEQLASIDNMSQVERDFWADPSMEPIVVFLHEYGHLAQDLLLTEEEQALVKEVFGSLKKSGRRTLFSAMSKGDSGSRYFAKNSDEFLVQAFAEWIVSRKVPDNRLLPVLRKLYDAFMSGVRRLLGLPDEIRGKVGKLTPIFERMLAGGDKSLAEIIAASEAGPAQGKGTLAPDPETARRALVRAESRGEVDTEQLSLNIQVSDLLNVMDKFVLTNVSDEARLLGKMDLERIQAQTNQPRITYEQFKAQYPDAPKALSIDAALKLVLEQDRWAKIRQQLEEQREKVNRKGFQKKMARLDEKEIQRDALKTAWENFQERVKAAIAKARTALKREGRNEARAQQLMREISSLESIDSYESAIEQALTDIVNVLAKSPDVTTLVSQNVPDVRAILSEYTRIKNQMVAAGESNPAQEDVIIGWAGEILGQSWLEAQRMILGALVGGNLQLQEQMSRYEQSVFRGMRDKPKSTIGDILRAARTNAKATALTTLAWQKLRREVSAEIEELAALERANQSITDIEADPDYKKYRAALTTDAGVEPRPDNTVKVGDETIRLSDLNYDAVSGHPIIPLPDGSVIQVHLVGDQRQFEMERVKLLEALDKYRDWKNDQDAKPPEERDPFYQYFVNWKQTIEQLYLSQRVTSPSSLETVGNPFTNEKPGAWDMPKFLLEDLGTRIGGAAKVSAANFSRTLQLARNLMTRQHELANAQMKAARSYKFKGSKSERVIQMYDRVLQPLFAMAQHAGFTLRVGMEVGQGFKVTKEAADLLRLERDLARAGFRIVQQEVPSERPGTAFVPVIKDHVHGVQWFGKSMEVNDTTLPFGGYTENGLALAQQWKEGKDPALLEFNFDLWFSHMEDRAGIVIDGESPFEAAYRKLVERIKANPPAFPERNLTWIIDQLAAITGDPTDQIREQMLSEMDKTLLRLANLKGEADPTVSVQTADQATSFTARRHDQSFPYYFLRYGFRTGADFINFIGNVHSGSLERFISGLGEVEKDLVEQRRLLTLEYEQRMQEGIPKRKAIKETIKRKQSEVLNGETTTQYRSINKRIKTTRRIIKMLTNIYGGGGSDAELDIRTWRRLQTGFVGSLLGAPTVMVRNATGLMYLGMLMSRFRNNAIRASVSVAARLIWDGLIRTGVAAPAFKAVKAIVGHGPFKASMDAVYDRLDRYQELEEAGLVTPLHWLEEIKAKLQSPATGGIILDTERGVAENTALTTIGLFDALILTGVAKPAFPRLGDKIINVTTSAATDDMVYELQHRLKQIFLDWEEAGALDTRLADPYFALTDEDMYPSKVFGTSSRQKMEFLKQAFEWSGVTLDEAARAYMTKLKAGQKKPDLLERWQHASLKDYILQTVNVPGPLNRPLWTHERNFFAQLFAPLTGWNVATLRQLVKYLSRAGVGKQSDWILIGLTVIPLLLTLGLIQDTGTEELIRLLYKAMGKERATRQPWEQTGADRQAVGMLVSAVNPIPYLSMVVNSSVNDMPGRASFDPTPVVINKLKDVFTYVGGVTRTGDPSFGLDRLVKGFVPLLDPLISNAPQAVGVQEALNFRRLLTRHGDPDLLRPQEASTAGLSTPLTPYGRKLLNAAMTGDEQGFLTLYREAVEKARQLGKADPERAVKTLFASQNPYDRAFRRKLTGNERETVLGKLTPDQRAAAVRVEDRYTKAAESIGVPANFERVEKATGGAGASVSAGRRSRRSRFGRGRIRAGRFRSRGARLGRRRQPRVSLRRRRY